MSRQSSVPAETISTDTALAPATEKRYRGALRQFARWRRTNGRSGELPMDEAVVIDYLQHLAGAGVSAGGLRIVACAVDFAHTSEDYDAVCSRSRRVGNLLRNHRRLHCCDPDDSGSEPLTEQELQQLLRNCQSAGKDEWRRVRDVALVTLMFCAALRRSEAAALLCGDVRIVKQGVRVWIRRSKTDQMGEGRTLTAPPLADTVAPGCVEALRRWLTVRQTVVWKPNVADRLFCFASETALSQHLYRRMGWLRLRKRVSSHSLRVSFATLSALRGTPVAILQRHMRHASVKTTGGYYRKADDAVVAGQIGAAWSGRGKKK